MLMASVDGTIVSVGLPKMQEDLDTTLALIGWTLTAYMLTQVIALPAAGKLSDELGRKRLFIASVVIFTVGSLGAGLAPNVYVHIIFRVIQALGSAAFMPAAIGILGETFAERRQTAIGLFASTFPIGGIVGPNLGGAIIDHLSWRWMFFVNLPIGVMLIYFGLKVLPSSARKMTGKPLDKAGMGLFAAGMLLALIGLTNWANNPQDVTALNVWLLVGVGLLALAAFLWHEGRAKAPMVEMQLLRSKPFLAANLYSFLFGACVFGYFTFIPYYAITGYGLTASQIGLAMTPRSVAAITLSIFSAFLLVKLGYRRPMMVGPVIIASSLFLLGLGLRDVVIFGYHMPNGVLLSLEVLLAGVGVGILNPVAQNASIDIHPEKIGAISGLRGMFSNTGGILGTTGIILALSHFDDKTAGFERIFLVLSLLILCSIPLVLLIPERVRKPPPAKMGQPPAV